MWCEGQEESRKKLEVMSRKSHDFGRELMVIFTWALSVTIRNGDKAWTRILALKKSVEEQWLSGLKTPNAYEVEGEKGKDST